MSKLTLVALAVLCSNPSGYRRAGFSLTQGENLIDANKEQLEALNADKSLTVSFVNDGFSDSDIATHVKSESILQTNLEQLRNDNERLKGRIEELVNQCSEQQETIALLEIEIATPPKYVQEDTLEDSSDDSIEINGLNVSSAPEELHHFIALLDDLNQKAPLTKKPNCDHLKMTINGGDVTPTAEQRDAAWAWYQDNVKIVEADDANSNSTTEAEA